MALAISPMGLLTGAAGTTAAAGATGIAGTNHMETYLVRLNE